MAHASPFAHVPAEIHQKVESSGLGLLTPWAPQQLILNSPVRINCVLCSVSSSDTILNRSLGGL